MTIQSVADLVCSGKKVFVRLDLNVPMRDGVVTDTTRIERALPTIRALLEKGAAVIIGSHFGRPQGQPVAAMTLRPVAELVERTLDTSVLFVDDLTGSRAKGAATALQPGQVMMIENLRFDAGEESNDAAFADALAALADLYVNDSFSCSHRAHASIEALARRLPAYAGLNLMQEMVSLGQVFSSSESPKAALVGGAKVSTKLDVLIHLVNKVDYLILGGGMANTFLLADGVQIGNSLCEKNMLSIVADIRAAASKSGCTLVLPVDARVADAFDKPETARESSLDNIAEHEMILDIGSQSIAELGSLFRRLRVLLWNGPLGVFEQPPFDSGTNAAARCAAELCRSGKLQAIAGGGDTVSALNHAGILEDITYVSTAGGAFLEWIEGKQLPGIVALERSVL